MLNTKEQLRLKIKNAENISSIVEMLDKIAAFVCILCVIALYQIGAFKKESLKNIGRFIEISALIICSIFLALAIIQKAYIEPMKEKLEKDSKQKQDTPLNENAKNAIQYITIIAFSIFVVSEILAVIQRFYDYGLSEAHGKSKISLQSIFDTVALCLLLIPAIISLSLSISKYKDAKNQQAEKDEESIRQLKNVRKELILPITCVALSVVAIIGRIVFALEMSGNIAVGKTDSGIFPLGVILRAIPLLAAITLSAVTIVSTMNKSEKKNQTQDKVDTSINSMSFKSQVTENSIK